ncbi:MAG: response regulator [Sulfurospirillum sp.]|nr:response regulator [Sulfurospirillum sp.]
MSMKFKTQDTLRLISFYPLLILFLFSSFFLWQSYTQYTQIENFEKKLKENEVLNALSINLAKERGLSATFLASDGAVAEDTLKQQRQTSNLSIKEFADFYNTRNRNLTITQIITMLNKIDEARKKVDSLDKDNFNDIFFDYYSQINAKILFELKSITKIATKSDLVSLSSSAVSIYQDIEYSGQERDFISKIISEYAPFSDEDLATWIELFGRSNTFYYGIDFNGKATNIIKNLKTSDERLRLSDELKNAKSEIIRAAQSGEYLMDPTLWFELASENIAFLEKASDAINEDLQEEVEEYYEEAYKRLGGAGGIWVISIILLIVGYFMSRQFRKNIKGLENIFKKVGELAETDAIVDFNTAAGMDAAYVVIDRAIENIAQQKNNAQEASAAKSIFLANMSHEIRTPLNGIIGFTELLKNTDLDDEKKEFVDVIEKSSENLLYIINNILDLSKVESNKIEIDEILFSPIEEFENAVEVYGPKAAEKNICLSLFIDPSLSNFLKGDITKIKEVLINLMSNAVKFTPQDGNITTEIKRTENTPSGKARLLFSVQDSGIGISEDKIVGIFDAFSQADSTITRKFGGTGLGLTISSKFISLMGGELKVESTSGAGSKFYFTLDFDESPSSEADLKNSFSQFSVAIYEQDKNPKISSQFLYAYMKYFGSNVRYYEDFVDLKNLIYKAGVNTMIVHYDTLVAGELEEYKKTHIPMILIMKSSQHGMFEKIRSQFIAPLYEPINLTKLTKTLEQFKDILPKQEEELKVVEQTVATKSVHKYGHKFDAKVLVAEDNEINQKLIKRTLENLGLEPIIVPNGKIAYEKRLSDNYDMIFMDIAMPVMDGIQATHKILEYEKENDIKHIPIVAVTANALKGDRERFMQEGLDEYITKPIKQEAILNILNMFIPEKIVEDQPKAIVQVQEKSEVSEVSEIQDLTIEASSPQKIANLVEDGDTDTHNILIMKKSPIETKIYTSILSKTIDKIDRASSLEEFLDFIAKNSYKIAIFDKEISGLDPETIAITLQNKGIHSIMFHDPSQEISEHITMLFDAVKPNIISKQQLEELICTYL